MHDDEREIRQLVATWMAATQAGDVDKVLSLMADDVVFLTPGTSVMRKADYAASARAMAGPNGPRFEGKSEILEVKLLGDWAFMWTRLNVVVTPPGGAPSTTRAGHTLTILTKQGGCWVIARDANLLAPAEGQQP
ncbi:MAG TPA: SgcJ/EcaC family oxidoreductase [Ideonella sp.]|nr:SgcJ/EcaC family oxidoreductase [Ideonella sp.]